MATFLAVRDNQARKAVALRPLTSNEDANVETFYGTTRQQYPAPRFDVTIGEAQDLETFLRAYPRYRMGEAAKGEDDGGTTEQVS